ncbi:MAG: tripartite tricarboxylate transporter TctB family protein [Devosiaceae bacterium]|nr:tripartite tricarboxylate transporter TctB family protein [Devosiaceae bacterium MH13]
MSRDRVGALLLLVFFAAYGYLSTKITLLPFQLNQAFHARTAPQFLTFAGVVLALFLLIRPSDDRPIDTSGMVFTRVALLCALMIFYGFTVRSLGFIASTSMFLIGGFWVMGERRPLVLLGASIPIAFGFWFLMVEVLDVFVAPWPAFLR